MAGGGAQARRPLRRRRAGADLGGDGRPRRRAGLSRRGRHHARAQHSDDTSAGRRQAARGRFHGRPGRQERRRSRAHRSDALQGAARSGGGQEGARRSDAGQCQARPRALPEARGKQRHQQAAGRYPGGRGRAGHRHRAGRPGRNRERAGDAELHHHHRPDRRPHRHPLGGPRQYRARLRRRLRDRDHYPAQADQRAVQPAAAGSRPGERGLRQSYASAGTPSRARWRSTRCAPTPTRSSSAASSP